jgi:hypothetical protein
MTGPKTEKHPWRVVLAGLAAIGLVLLVVVFATSGGGSTSPSYGAPAARQAQASPPGGSHGTAATAPKPNKQASPGPAVTSNPSVPQGNGGDADADNNGGPDDGDGGI